MVHIKKKKKIFRTTVGPSIKNPTHYLNLTYSNGQIE